MKLLVTCTVLFSAMPIAAQKPQRVAAELQALVTAQTKAPPVVATGAATTRCPAAVLEPVVTILEAQSPLEVYQTLQNGDFTAASRVDAEDPRDGLADTDWVSASWSSPSGILWGRDYAPDTVFEGITRLLDNRQARINAYTLSFASLTPRLVIHGLVHQGTDDAWLMLSVNGVMVGIPSADQVSRVGWPRCAEGLFFLDDAFDARGYIPEKYLS